jgi:hypothetical protein
MMTNIEFLKMQKLAGLITENQYRTIILETTLSPEDQKIVNDILGENLEEGGEVVINSEILDSSYGDGVKNFFAKHRIRYFGIGRNGNIKVKNI